MTKDDRYEKQKDHWEFAGKVGYGKATFSCEEVERHIVGKQWRTSLEIAESIGLGPGSRILELGCGDGSFARQALAPRFKSVDAYDNSNAAIERARSQCVFKNLNFDVKDVAGLHYAKDSAWNGAFLVGFLHHVKPFAHSIVERLATVCPKVVLLEPNGDNFIRKGLEMLPSYKKAGENSFRLKELMGLFEKQGYRRKALKRINLIPPFLPGALLPLMETAERCIENNPLLSRACSSYVLGFVKETS